MSTYLTALNTCMRGQVPLEVVKYGRLLHTQNDTKLTSLTRYQVQLCVELFPVIDLDEGNYKWFVVVVEKQKLVKALAVHELTIHLILAFFSAVSQSR